MKYIRILLLSTLTIGLLACSSAKKSTQSKNKKSRKNQSEVVAAPPKTPSKDPVPLNSFFKEGAPVKTQGLVNVYVAPDSRYYIEIADSLLGKDLLIVNRISKSAAGFRQGVSFYAGDHINNNMIRFEKGAKNKLLIRKIMEREISKDSTKEMYEAVMRSNLHAIMANLDIKALTKDSVKGDQSYLIDITDLINSENELFTFNKYYKDAYKITRLQSDKSYIESIRTYPKNTEFRAVQTFTAQNNETVTFELNSSLILLPDTLMTPRYFDERVGYFADYKIDFDRDPQGVKATRMVKRWRLEPRQEDMEKYKNGELVEPEKPIIFYIDPATPAKWIPYLMQGVNDWQTAFEKAGFKNAIMAKRAPSREEDSTWSLEDARFSAIVYKPSAVADASGPHISDPRTGEILESHINWYHNVMSLLHDWYFIQCSPLDTGAQKMTFDDELMGQLIRFVSSHEVGHTLGLRHNFGSSFTTAVENLRNSEFLKEHGHANSIMDYARFNFVAQPEDRIPRELLFPRINIYDNWAIEWGYRLFPEINDPIAELPKMNEWVIEKLKDNRLWFGTETNPNDPRSQAEDLGDNQMKANELGIKNLKIVVANLSKWTKVPDADYENLKSTYNQVVTQYLRYTGHVAKWIGGIYETPKRVEQAGDIYVFVEKAKQKEAFDYLNKNIFETPDWLLSNDIFAKTQILPSSVMNTIHTSAIRAMINVRVLRNLSSAELVLGKEAYTLADYFGDLNKTIFKPGKTDAYRRNLQKVYISTLLDMVPELKALLVVKDNTTALTRPSGDSSDITAFVIYQLKGLQKQLKTMSGTDAMTKAHYEYLSELIKTKLE